MTRRALIAPRVVAALVALALGVAACSSAGASPSPSIGGSLLPPQSAAPSTPAPATPAPTAAGNACPDSAPPPLPAGQTRTVTIETEKGTIKVRIDGALSPNAAGNFVALAECGFYEGVVFHRLVPDFVIQGGDPTGTGGGGPGYTIRDEEVKGEYKRGTLAMARTSAPDSQGSQFFIVLSDEAKRALESYRTYAIFGEVIEGMDVADAIAAMPNSGDQAGNAALVPVAMTKLTVTTP